MCLLGLQSLPFAAEPGTALCLPVQGAAGLQGVL